MLTYQPASLPNHLKVYLTTAAGCLLSLQVNAAIGLPSSASDNHPWSVTASLGYTDYQQAYQSDGQTALGRLAIDRALFIKKHTALGLELGVQNGNSMRLDAPQATLDVLGGLPIQSTVKPLLDLLATAKTEALGKSLVFAQVKGGIAYRRWQFEDRTSVSNLSNIAGELQAGFGIPLSQTTNLSLLYQGIYGGNPNFTVNATNGTGHVSTIPIQQGALLSLSVTV